jgi:hypothetical protein
MNNDEMLDRMIALQDSEPSEEVQGANEAINAANDLEMTVGTRGWAIILDVLSEIKTEAEDKLFEQAAGDDRAILAAFSGAQAVRAAFQSLLEAVQNIRSSGEEARQFLKYQSEVDSLNEVY